MKMLNLIGLCKIVFYDLINKDVQISDNKSHLDKAINWLFLAKGT